MKKLLFIPLILAMLAACNKDQVVPTTVTIISNNPLDTFTLVDNGITYTDTQSFQFGSGASITLIEQGAQDFLAINTNPNGHFPISFALQSIQGPTSGTGLYTEPRRDSAISGNSFAETYSGGEGYTVDSVAINITTVSSTALLGTYQAWLTNIAGSKTISGVIKCHHPRIQ